MRAGIQLVLEQNGFEILGVAGDATALRDLAGRVRPDGAIIDIRMPPQMTDDGLRAAAWLRQHYPRMAVLLLSQFVETRDVVDLLGRGGNQGIGYLLKDAVTDERMFAADVRRVLDGGVVIDPVVGRRLIGRQRVRGDLLDGLTPRERQTLELMAQGLSNRAIAARQLLRERTVEANIGKIFTKLDLAPVPDNHRRVLAVLSYLRNQWPC